ncbi:MAG: hypothetical protein AB7G37_21695 [Solirubrobacteraceae bacterium]
MSSTSSQQSSAGGIGFGGLLTLVFIVLKLTGVIAWSWWWVLSPLWIGFLLWVVILIVAAIVVWRSET